jgi:tetratricopeptide (TPR) repeat protein
MTAIHTQITQIESQIETALWSLETAGELGPALSAYQQAETRLEALAIQPADPLYAEYQRVLAYCLMRQGNLLRQMARPQKALSLSQREILAARASGDSIALARSLLSNGINYLVAGEQEEALGLLDESRTLFEQGDSYDHQQGLGWYWILQADLINAGLIAGDPAAVIAAADRALALLLPLENWPGVARSYAARALARERSGDLAAAQADRLAQGQYEAKIKPG